ncbi:hypothetical protein [Bradyrhizobium sp. CCGUVB23]|nr:hypothetical protein [Bradyrhizobium sp. CCGUVB23]
MTAMQWKPNSPATRKKHRRCDDVVRRQLGNDNKIRSIYNRAAY